jgi:hypothetical protein
VVADQIQQFVPWTNLAWYQVHNGHIPLWNPYNVTGLPLAFNWQSGVFSLPTLVGYLLPVSYAFTAIVLTKLVIAGTGAYVLCRIMRLGPLAAALGGTAFELSGPMIVHAGWPFPSVTCWAGWILAAVVGLLGNTHRVRNVTMLAIAVGFAVYGGHPESLIVMGLVVVFFVVVCLVARPRSAEGPVVRPLLYCTLGGVCGLGLGAPLLFPGFQLGQASVRGYANGTPAFPLTHVATLLAVGLPGNDLGTTAAYVGVVVVALAVVGTRMSWERPEIRALAAVTVVTALLTFASPVDELLRAVPGGRTVTWNRAVMILALALAVLAATGMDALVRSTKDLTAVSWAAGAFGLLGLFVLALFLADQLGLGPSSLRHEASLVWPAVQAVVGLGLTGAWWWSRRPAAKSGSSAGTIYRRVPAILLALETGFLLSAGIPFWSVSSTYFATDPPVTTLQRDVGSALVGFSTCHPQYYLKYSPQEVGIWPDANVAYRVREFAVYDPILPEKYLHEWRAIGGHHFPTSLSDVGLFCARITTTPEARLFGVRYLLESPDSARPIGTVPVAKLGNETLVSVPDAADATSSPVPAGGAPLSTEAPGVPLAVTHPDPASWRIALNATTPSIVRLRLTAVPGWHASINGRPLALRPWAGGTMLEVQVPAGRQVIEVHYWPLAFTVGIAVATSIFTGLVLAALGGFVLGRRRGRHAPSP